MSCLAQRLAEAVRALTSGKLAVETAPTGDVAVEESVGAVLTAKKTPLPASWCSVREGLGVMAGLAARRGRACANVWKARGRDRSHR